VSLIISSRSFFVSAGRIADILAHRCALLGLNGVMGADNLR
jgi:hypothetical protein